MKKGQRPLIAGLDLGDTGCSTARVTRKFTGTDNPRHLRVVHALMLRPRRRKEIDRIAGASNGPELIAELRRQGLAIKCDRVPVIDRDGRIARCGVYSFDDADCRAVAAWWRKRATAKAR